MDIAANEDKVVAFCTLPNLLAPGARIFPKDIIRSAYNKTEHYVQVTGLIDRNLYQLSVNDQGGQYDIKPRQDSSCAGYKYCLNLVEPNDNIYCIRCCDNKKDCDMNHSTYDCKALIKDGIYTELKPTKTTDDRIHINSDPTHPILATPIVTKTTDPLDVKISSLAIILPPIETTATSIKIPTLPSIHFPVDVNSIISDTVALAPSPTNPLDVKIPRAATIVPTAGIPTRLPSIRFHSDIIANISDIMTPAPNPSTDPMNFELPSSAIIVPSADATTTTTAPTTTSIRFPSDITANLSDISTPAPSPTTKPIAPEGEQQLKNIREAIERYKRRARIAIEASNKKKSDEASEKYHVELEKEEQSLQKIKKVNAMCQHARIAREAANKQNTEEASERYSIEFEKEPRDFRGSKMRSRPASNVPVLPAKPQSRRRRTKPMRSTARIRR